MIPLLAVVAVLEPLVETVLLALLVATEVTAFSHLLLVFLRTVAVVAVVLRLGMERMVPAV
jgi:hypothetical protein